MLAYTTCGEIVKAVDAFHAEIELFVSKLFEHTTYVSSMFSYEYHMFSREIIGCLELLLETSDRAEILQVIRGFYVLCAHKFARRLLISTPN